MNYILKIIFIYLFKLRMHGTGHNFESDPILMYTEESIGVNYRPKLV